MEFQKRLSTELNRIYAGTIVAQKSKLVNSIYENSLPYTDFHVKSDNGKETIIDINFSHVVIEVKLLWDLNPHGFYRLNRIV